MPNPHREPPPTSDELRNMMFAAWGDRVGPGKLEDIDRAARLYGIVKDHYDALAFGRLSREEKLDLCANRLMELGEWQKASRLLLRLEQIDREKARLAHKRQQQALYRFEPDPDPEPEPQSDPEPEPEPSPPPMLFGRRWSHAQLRELITNYPDLADRPYAEILEIVSAFPPAPDT